MNFLLRPSQQSAIVDQPTLNVSDGSSAQLSKSMTLEGLIAEDSFPQYYSADDSRIETDGTRTDQVSIPGPRNDAPVVEKHVDVSEEEGWITVPHGKLPEAWQSSPDIRSLRSWDRSFVFPGEQVHILACLSASEQDSEVITPFKVAAIMSKNGMGHGIRNEKAGPDGEGSENGNFHASHLDAGESNDHPSKEEITPQKNISDGESLLKMEDQKRKTERLLQSFKNSQFFVRFDFSGEALWSKRSTRKFSSYPMGTDAENLVTVSSSTDRHLVDKNVTVEKGNFDANTSGGVARNSVQCYSLANGDIVVLLQVNIGDNLLQDPVLEIRQFERHSTESLSDQEGNDLLNAYNEPCGELLTWLFPLDNTSAPPRSLSPPPLSSSGIGSTSQKSNFTGSSGSQIFSFGNFRSYSMSSLPQNSSQVTSAVTTPSSKSSSELENWDKFSGKKLSKSQVAGKDGLLSFRGISLEPERFSVCCGLEGVYIPGRRWKRKLEIIQPVEIHSFPADCNTDDLLCVQIKNVSPAHIPEIIVYIDAITIVLEETSRKMPPLSLPIASIEVGDDHNLPNLPLRRGEEHSFILKPAISTWKKLISQDRTGAQLSRGALGNASKSSPLSKPMDGKENASSMDHYSIMVSCHCNASESRLFFKQPTNWRPRIARDIMISVACKTGTESNVPNLPVSQLPVQVLTLKASNLTSEDLTMTILAPASFTSSPSLLSLNYSLTSPTGPSRGLSNALGKSRNQATAGSLPSENGHRKNDNDNRVDSLNDHASPVSDAIPSAGFGCSHLWLQSKVPLGCVPSQSTATIKLELLPLTDGIITLDTLQIDVKEKGVTYIPEHSLKIIATSSISTGLS
ncbi:hypothetical protein MLD38_018895 [Melastoma candidum]|uniref:Uncharacterized protein n=1 Tax=Melastoma candidum TaxID=119954 RepID=A0ACB9QVT3_9MYRT|nr:hypothetical protein MLD38_018895 [Melastoma candidum]